MSQLNKLSQYFIHFTFTEVQAIFLKILREEEDVSAGVAAIRTLLSVIENYKGWYNARTS